MISKAWSECPSNTGEVSATVLPQEVTKLPTFLESRRKRPHKHLPSSQRLNVIMSPVPQPLSAEQLPYYSTGWSHNGTRLCGCERAHNEPEEVVEEVVLVC